MSKQFVVKSNSGKMKVCTTFKAAEKLLRKMEVNNPNYNYKIVVQYIK